MIPPLGKFLDPLHGFWQNAESVSMLPGQNVIIEDLSDSASVFFDDRLVPHVFAKNEQDLFYLQGYITAYFRLWQMEFQTHFAAGRISEIVGPKALDLDRSQRRLGLLWSAQRAHEYASKDSLTLKAMEAYTRGVNAFINNLNYKNYPIEYKLLDYSPELWTTLKPVLLLKFMSNTLAGSGSDIANTNALRLFGKEKFDILYPIFLEDISPIIPSGTSYNFVPIEIKDPGVPLLIDMGKEPLSETVVPYLNAMAGSNNWAVSGKKTASGNALLCADPHLKLQLPSIWYEIQMNAPGINTYGVSLPGTPAIIMGFNDSIAWGSTNAAIDIKDWYKITFKDNHKSEYLYDGKWLKAEKRVEAIHIRGEETFFDTVTYTRYGPVVYDETFKPGNHSSSIDLAMRWTVHDPSNEFLTFYKLNKAENYKDFVEALSYYQCPAQNFAYASVSGDIAIWQQGKLVAKWKNQGRFVMDGANSKYDWQGFVPQDQYPHILNPERGFIHSTNQHPTDTAYSYFYDGIFEAYRGRRVAQCLSEMKNITLKDIQQLQNDNYNLRAFESIPVMLQYLDRNNLNEEEKKVVMILEKWNYYNNANEIAPTYYDVWWKELFNSIWDEMEADSTIDLSLPYRYTAIKLLKEDADNVFMDIISTPGKRETASDLVALSFHKIVKEFSEKSMEEILWGHFNSTTIEHLARLPAFSDKGIITAGGSDIVNATRGGHGPSWRMIVEMDREEVKAWGVYPGGQSGNPGSPYYDDFIDKWAKGEYFPLHFFKNRKDAQKVLSASGHSIVMEIMPAK